MFDFLIPTDQDCTLALNVAVQDAAGKAVTSYAGKYTAEYTLGGPPPLGKDDSSADVPVDCRNAAIAVAAHDLAQQMIKDRSSFEKLAAPAPTAAAPSETPAPQKAQKEWWQN